MTACLQRLAPDRIAGGNPAITAVCSAHPLVLEAALRHAAASGRSVLIEATCNQVNQDGGYTGLTPAAFHAHVHRLAATCGLAPGRLILGGDHLGPNPWTSLPAAAAMEKAQTLVAGFVAAGFTKLHLDCSMACAGDPASLADAVIAARAARLAAVAEATARRTGQPPPLYVIGTEVPPPGGARAWPAHAPTDPAAAARGLRAHADAFAAAGIAAAMDRVIALVVQPGVEFGAEHILPYDPQAACPLRRVLDDHPGLVFEAHSTDYQSPQALAALARDGFAILKVGPWLTFALRAALYRLDAAQPSGPRVQPVMERLMLADPRHWQGHHHADLRHHGLGDRIRYYWPHPEAVAAVAALLAAPAARAEVLAAVTAVLDIYAAAGPQPCSGTGTSKAFSVTETMQ